MYIINNTSTNPYWNLAAEEYLLRAFSDDFFMLWRNEPAIIIGRHQNANAEINIDYVQQQDIKVIRRISGGGAVFHDLGNINFTFIQGGDDPKATDFEKYTQPIITVLQKLGVNAEMEGRNDISIDGKKVSGNAEHILKNRILHHGTLLFSAKMLDLSSALKVNPVKYKDRSVKSIRKRVSNISDHLPEPITLEQFTNLIIEHINTAYPKSKIYQFSAADHQEIEKLVEEKYHTWEWNFGKSPDYNFKQAGRTGGGTIEINLDVHEGVIHQAKIYGDFFSTKDISHIEKLLQDAHHEPKAIKERLNQVQFNDYFNQVNLEEFIKIMF